MISMPYLMILTTIPSTESREEPCEYEVARLGRMSNLNSSLRKVQYPELRKEMSSDFAVFKTMGAQIKQMAAGYDLMWVVEERKADKLFNQASLYRFVPSVGLSS